MTDEDLEAIRAAAMVLNGFGRATLARRLSEIADREEGTKKGPVPATR